MRCGKRPNSPRTDHARRTGLNNEAAIAIETTRYRKIRRSYSRNQPRTCPPHDFRDIEQMIEMRVSDEHRIRARPDMLQAESDSRLVRLDSLLHCHRRYSGTGEVWIHQQGVPACFKLVTINAEISHSHRPRPFLCSRRISNDERGILLEIRKRNWRGETE